MVPARAQRRKPAYARRRRLLVAVTAASAIGPLACVSAASARSDHAPASPASGAPSQAAAKAQPELPGSSAPKAAKLQAPPAGPTPATGGAGGGAAQHGHARKTLGGAQGKQSVGGAQGKQSPTAGTPLSAAKPGRPGAAKGAESGSASEQRQTHKGAGHASPPHVTRAKANRLQAAPASAAGAAAASTSAAPAGVSPPAPAVATAATVPVSAAAAASAPAVSSKPRGAAATRSARAAGRHRRAGRRAAFTAAAAQALPAGALLASASAPRVVSVTSTAPRTPRSGHSASSPSIVAPLATTITKIVGVVPTPVRALIGALLALALALAVRSRFAARRARRLERQRGQLLEDVGLLQAALLPVPPVRLGPVGTTAAYRPAAGPAAGGDFYDVFALEDGQLAVIVGDVSGHGRKALPHTALVRFTLRAYLEAGMSPRGAVQTAGAVLERQLGGFFVTVVAATYNPRTRILVYSSAGHPPPVIIGADHAALAPVTVSSSPPIGVGLPTGTRQSVVSVPGRAQICFHTDGVTEARVASELFGSRRLTATLVELGPKGSASELLDRVAELADSRPDDMAACLLSIEGNGQAPRAEREELELDRASATSERTERFLLSCGLQAAEVPAVLHIAAAGAARSGSVVLEVHHENGRARASLQHDNLSYLHARHAPHAAELTVSR
jgi:serine phosphatase RsbU (regulator of sigma subunit)